MIFSLLQHFFSPSVVLAGGAVSRGLTATADAADLDQYGNSLPVVIGTVAGALLSLIGIIFFILIVYAGIMWMTAAGNQDMVKKSINTIIAAAIGLVVVLSAYAITQFVLDTVQGSASSSNSNTNSEPQGGFDFGDDDVTRICTADSGCADGEICNDFGECVDSVWTFGEVGEVCEASDDCSSGLVCGHEDRCISEDHYCFSDEECIERGMLACLFATEGPLAGSGLGECE